nr:hypothetical protein Iba_chr02bCG20240 [Ipomoea batatas]GMC71190.1 hypothetical protein Iba_chr03bCG0440 [Ipomoea batatas]
MVDGKLRLKVGKIGGRKFAEFLAPNVQGCWAVRNLCKVF